MARRAIGEGSVYKRPDGKWIGEATVGWADGARKRRRVVARTQREAKQRLNEVMGRAAEGATVASDKLTVSAWLDEWLEKEAKPNVRPRTLDGYAQLVRDHLKPEIGYLLLRKLDSRHVRDLLAKKATEADAKQGKRKGKPLSPRTVELMHAVLRRALNRALAHGLIPKNPAVLVQPPPVRRAERFPLTPQQSKAFLASIEGHKHEMLFRVAMATGLRQSELLALRWQDIDFDAGMLRVTHSLQRYAGAYHLDNPKTDKSRRAVALPEPVLDALRGQSTRQKADRMKAGPAWEGEAWNLIFATESGTPLSGASVTHAFQTALEVAQLPKVRFHDLRHGTATYLLAAGIHMKVVQEVLGHADMATTADIYSHVLPDVQREAADRIAAILFA